MKRMMPAPQYYLKFVSLASMINKLSHFVQDTLEINISGCCPVSHFGTLVKIYRRHCIDLYRASTNGANVGRDLILHLIEWFEFKGTLSLYEPDFAKFTQPIN